MSEEAFVREGKVVFLWGDFDPEKPPFSTGGWCVCCGDPDVPHAHNYGRRIEFDSEKDPIYEFLRRNDIEGKRVRLTIEVLE
jgi:hypothetical protein